MESICLMQLHRLDDSQCSAGKHYDDKVGSKIFLFFFNVLK